MDDGQWQSDGPVRRGGVIDQDLLNDSESSRSPDENQNRLVEEVDEVEQGPFQQDNNNNGDNEDYDRSKVEDEEEEEEEEEEVDSNSGAYSPELDGQIRDSPTPSPSPTVSEGLVSPEGPPCSDAGLPQGFSRSLAVSLQELGEQGDHPLLPQYLHQIAESFIREEDYERAVRFIQLERLFHERLLSNLATLQEQWERRLSLVGRWQDGIEDRATDLDAKHLDKLRHICRTHRQPVRSIEKCEVVSKVHRNSVMSDKQGGENNLNTQVLSCSSGTVMEEHSTNDTLTQPDDHCSTTPPPQQSKQQHDPSPFSATPTSSSLAVTDSSFSPACEDAKEGEERVSLVDSHQDASLEPAHLPSEPQMDTVGSGPVMGDTVDTGQHVVETHTEEKEEVVEEVLKLDQQDVHENNPELDPEENGHGVETLDITTVPTLDDMAKRIKVEETTPAAGLVSILKRRASLDGANSPTPAVSKPISKRKVRFQEPEEGLDHDEVGGDSWLLLLLLCLATVVISLGGTALYCTFGDAQSSVCTDFSHNMDFYISQVQRVMEELKHWLSPSS
ncbi:consortin-like [Xyrauchen texanus]|uniref:consortin-like n=1 Tax=Xyrauchen texanus TaxID=154827 RepID=UPI0022429616|nr:consortin-like [Xyrauchen texanus]XP_052001623.1 consortin-like [Xyrauchen texanus]